MLDGAGTHNHMKAFLRAQLAEYIDDWPPHSPDLDAIEKMWGSLEAADGIASPIVPKHV